MLWLNIRLGSAVGDQRRRAPRAPGGSPFVMVVVGAIGHNNASDDGAWDLSWRLLRTFFVYLIVRTGEIAIRHAFWFSACCPLAYMGCDQRGANVPAILLARRRRLSVLRQEPIPEPTPGKIIPLREGELILGPLSAVAPSHRWNLLVIQPVPV